MRKWLNIAAGVTGIFAALLWFLSARTLPAPAQSAYWDVAEDSKNAFPQKMAPIVDVECLARVSNRGSILLRSIA
jgi:hypothetical protein